MFTTYATEAPMPARHTAVQAAENDGKIYFFSATDSDKNRKINRSPEYNYSLPTQVKMNI